jgi:hypothetical protein
MSNSPTTASDITQPLSMTASAEQQLERITALKLTALNLVSEQFSHEDAKYLHPRELKAMTDIVLNMEDSIQQETPEGALVRKAQRLLDKYGATVPQTGAKQEYTEAEVVEDED